MFDSMSEFRDPTDSRKVDIQVQNWDDLIDLISKLRNSPMKDSEIHLNLTAPTQEIFNEYVFSENAITV